MGTRLEAQTTAVLFPKTAVYERLRPQVGVHFINRLPDSVKTVPMLTALKIRLKTLFGVNGIL